MQRNLSLDDWVADKTDIGFSNFADAASLRTCGKYLAAMWHKS